MRADPIEVASAAELADLLRSRRSGSAAAGGGPAAGATTMTPVRLLGSGSRQHRLPPARDGAQHVSTRRLDRIERLEPDDLTCSVQPGVPCRALAAELASRRLVLGCLGGGDGTIGGLFAEDPIGAATVGAPSPRSVLLGLDGVLADGTRWKSGAQVVKSVAGFDVHRLFVGSRGTLFAATLLHLKLRPLPPATVDFSVATAELGAAVERFVALRRSAPAPERLALHRTASGCAVHGRLQGRANWIRETMRTFGLAEHDGPPPPELLDAAPGREVANGIVRPSRIAALLATLPADAPFVVHGGGRFEVAAAPAAIDALLQRAPGLDAAATIVGGAPHRRGRSSAIDPGAERLQREMARALDPENVLT